MKNKLFISYAFTGQAKEDIEARLGTIFAALDKLKIDYYCNYFDPAVEAFTTPGQFIDHATEQLKDCNRGVLALIATENKSEGQLLELGVAYGHKLPIYTLVHESVIGKTYVNDPAVSTKTTIWKSLDSLEAAVRTVLL